MDYLYALRKKYSIFAFDNSFRKQMIENGVEIKGTLDDLIRVSEIIVDFTPGNYTNTLTVL